MEIAENMVPVKPTFTFIKEGRNSMWISNCVIMERIPHHTFIHMCMN